MTAFYYKINTTRTECEIVIKVKISNLPFYQTRHLFLLIHFDSFVCFFMHHLFKNRIRIYIQTVQWIKFITVNNKSKISTVNSDFFLFSGISAETNLKAGSKFDEVDLKMSRSRIIACRLCCTSGIRKMWTISTRMLQHRSSTMWFSEHAVAGGEGKYSVFFYFVWDCYPSVSYWNSIEKKSEVRQQQHRRRMAKLKIRWLSKCVCTNTGKSLLVNWLTVLYHPRLFSQRCFNIFLIRLGEYWESQIRADNATNDCTIENTFQLNNQMSSLAKFQLPFFPDCR